MKRCTKCGRLLPETEFYKVSNTERLKPTCKECDKKYAKAYYAMRKRAEVPRKPRKEKKKKIKRPSSTTARCKSCIYRTTLTTDNDLACYYIVVTGKRRRCPAGDKCKRYIKGRCAPVPKSIKGQYIFEGKRDGGSVSHKISD